MDTIRTNIENRIIPILDKAGMYYRIFSRVKSTSSINRKLSKKAIEYREKGKKMQDIIGIRIIFYFQEDVNIFYEKLKCMEGYDKNNGKYSVKVGKHPTPILAV